MVIDPKAPTTIYAGTQEGLFKTLDGGQKWSLVGKVLRNTYVIALAIDPVTPNTLYVGTDTGIFKSTDGGESWSKLGLNVNHIKALTLDPSTLTILYVGTEDKGVYIVRPVK
jgi:photosystem II stability/assembly factor-like uncharacterized protein